MHSQRPIYNPIITLHLSFYLPPLPLSLLVQVFYFYFLLLVVFSLLISISYNLKPTFFSIRWRDCSDRLNLHRPPPPSRGLQPRGHLPNRHHSYRFHPRYHLPSHLRGILFVLLFIPLFVSHFWSWFSFLVFVFLLIYYCRSMETTNQ